MPDAARAVPAYFAEVMTWFEGLPQCRTLGLRHVASEAGKVTLELPFQDALIGNPETRVVHGGAVTTLIDTASGTSLFTLLPAPEVIATLDLRIDYLRPAKPDASIFCTAECYRLTEHIAFTRATAFQDDITKPVAYAVATFARGTSHGKEG
ncbi:PaaI family thioesterase [Jeongeupia naejangsanensis]|uniref:PaaI family thioesterase n=1 Tax=Jeongeupia naejangsanensis TaxID=613195 RepID=A0ABS2BII5_9NEIS|nr:PaaI family thioesterase [Jeongeupia naejangsanensis]MBM3115428.1 PaaI family thioesterase [Jeongeupia naejangsanensis]